MLSRLILPRIEFRLLPPLFCLSVGALFGLLIVTFVLGERANQKQAELLREYGSALAHISAQDVIDSSISSDLVSMHAVMQRVVAQPRVLRAAVHDLEQQLLVQAGQSSLRDYDTTQVFSAAIPLHDSIAGHVTITMDAGFPGESAVKWTLTGMSILLLILAGLALYESRGVAWYFQSKPQSEPEPEPESEPEFEAVGDNLAFNGEEALMEELMEEADHYFHDQNVIDAERTGDDGVSSGVEDDPADPTDAEGDQVLALPPEPIIMHSDLIIALPNRARLEQQLNGERFLQLTSQFDKALHEVLPLYGGALVGANADASIVCMRFTSTESVAEAAFRAICSAYLVHGLTQSSRIRLQLVAEVCHPDSDVKLAITETGIFIQKPLADPFLLSRIDTETVSDQRLRFQGFKGTFASLLQRQQQQLQQQQLMDH